MRERIRIVIGVVLVLLAAEPAIAARPGAVGAPRNVRVGNRAWTLQRGTIELTGSGVQLWLEYAGASGEASPVRIGVLYRQGVAPSQAPSVNVPELGSIFQASRWEQELDTSGERQQEEPELVAGIPESTLLAQAGEAEYRVTSDDRSDLVALLAAILKPATQLYELSVEYAADATVEQGNTILPGPLGPPDIYVTREGMWELGVELPYPRAAPLTIAVRLQRDRYLFGVDGVRRETRRLEIATDLTVELDGSQVAPEVDPDGLVRVRLEDPGTVRVLRIGCGVQLQGDSARSLSTGLQVTLKLGAMAGQPRFVARPASEKLADVAAALAGALQEGAGPKAGEFTTQREYGRPTGHGALPAELAALLLASPEPEDESRQWRTSAFWSAELKRPFGRLLARRREGATAAQLGAEPGAAGPAMGLFAATRDAYWGQVAAAAAEWPEQPCALPVTGWGLPLAEAAVRTLALTGLGPSASTPASFLASAVAADAGPCDYFFEKPGCEAVCPSGAPDPRGLAAVALIAGGFARAGQDQARRLLDKHLAGWVGYSRCESKDFPNRSRGTPQTAYRAQALAVHAWLAAAASGASDAPELRAAASKLRARVLTQCWDPLMGGFCPLAFTLGSGQAQPIAEPGRFDIADQFWALSVFADAPFPYFALKGDR